MRDGSLILTKRRLRITRTRACHRRFRRLDSATVPRYALTTLRAHTPHTRRTHAHMHTLQGTLTYHITVTYILVHAEEGERERERERERESACARERGSERGSESERGREKVRESTHTSK